MISDYLPKLHPDRTGYILDDEFVKGFKHRTDISERGQLRIARWAKQLGYKLDPEQKRLLHEAEESPPSPRAAMARQATEALRAPWVEWMWSTLTRRQQELVLAPDKHPKLREVSWPMTTRELATLVGCEDHQIRRWADKRKLPHWRKGRNRLFPQAAAIAAFALNGLDQLDQSYASRVTKPDGLEHLKVSVATAALERISRAESAPEGELTEFATGLREIADGIDTLIVTMKEPDDEERLGAIRGSVLAAAEDGIL